MFCIDVTLLIFKNNIHNLIIATGIHPQRHIMMYVNTSLNVDDYNFYCCVFDV